jgi:glycerophosphoryl diester phosphodiesterase
MSSFSVEALEAAMAAAPEIARGYLVGGIPKDWRATMERLGCIALHCNRRALKTQLAEEIVKAGYGILCWTVNDRRQAHKLLGRGASCIVTDRLDRIPPGFA